MSIAAILIFILTYTLIAGRRLVALPIGRPAGALLGALLMVVFGALSPEESYRAVDADTILLLFSMMLLSGYLGKSGVFSSIFSALLRVCRLPEGLLYAIAALSASLSAFLVNDTVCLMMTPIVVSICSRHKLPMGPYLIALATSANIGSAATLVGNPQNMIIGSMSDYGFARFMAVSGPAALAGMIVNIALLKVYFARRLPRAFTEDVGFESTINLKRPPFSVLVFVAVAACFLSGTHMGYTALAGAVLIMLRERKEPTEALGGVDWTLLLFFAALFVVVEGLASTGVVEKSWDAFSYALRTDTPSGMTMFAVFMTVGSNLVSNVPMVLLTGSHIEGFGSPDRAWALLAYTATVAGNLTLLGSVANIIVAEQSKKSYNLGFFEYLKFGAVSTALAMTAGVIVIALLT
ncbi:MAG TPA: SLC13 family permease [bacterium]|nr:SLC13 family permease [bacterium]